DLLHGLLRAPARRPARAGQLHRTDHAHAPGQPLGVGRAGLRSGDGYRHQRPRTAFPGNILPTRPINPIAPRYISLYPEPNRPGLEDTYFTNQLRPYDYNAVVGRLDHNFNPDNRVFLSAYWNKRQEDRYNWAKGASNATGEGAINGFEVTRGFD